MSRDFCPKCLKVWKEWGAGQAERIQRRLWVLLNMETPERKPASSTAKKPKVRQRATTNLQKGKELDQSF